MKALNALRELHVELLFDTLVQKVADSFVVDLTHTADELYLRSDGEGAHPVYLQNAT